MRRPMLALSGVVAVVVAAVGGIGALHHPAARGWLRAAGGCPVPVGPADPVAQDARRAEAWASLAGPGAGDPAVIDGLIVGQTDRGGFVAWATERGATCGLTRGDGVSCVGVAFDGADHTVSADLDARGRVVAVSALARISEADVAVDAVERTESHWSSGMGAPTRVSGQASAAWLSAAPARQRRAEWRREDLFARVSATRLDDGFVVSRVVQVLGA